MINFIIKWFIKILVLFSLDILYNSSNFVVIYRISCISLTTTSTFGSNISRKGNNSLKWFHGCLFTNFSSLNTYSFINNPIKLNYGNFKLEATKGKKSSSTSSSKPKSGATKSKAGVKRPRTTSTKAAPKIRPPSRPAPKKKEKPLSKSKLGSLKAKLKKKKEKKDYIPYTQTEFTLGEEDKEEMEREYQRRIAITDTKSYREKIKMDLFMDDSRPYMSIFDSEVITKDDLIGFDMPYGLVPRDRYELWKLCGKISDPCAPFSSQSLTTKIFMDRLFKNEFEIDRDDFNYIIDYKMKFYTPGYGEFFFMDKIRCWRAWYLVRDCKYGTEDLPTYLSIYPIERPENYIPLSHVMLAVNCEINRQGVHPSLLDMLWDFFTDNPSKLTRDIVTYKLNWIIDRIDNRDHHEGISPDNFYRIFYKSAQQYLNNFDKDSFLRSQYNNLCYNNTHKLMLMNNKALRKRNQILKDAYNEELKMLYKPIIPRTYTKYERKRLAGYFNMLNHMYEMRKRRKALPPKEVPVYTEEELEKMKEDEPFERVIQKQMIKEKREKEMKIRQAKRARKKKNK